ncbi:MAG: hypothetical protein H0U00_06805, partial [Actinobacteria bacterium]|nr:hypothetical protein [Actinomycetota bacterium]
MAEVAVMTPARPRPFGKATATAARAGTLLFVLLGLWGLWEGYRWLWMETGWTKPFVVDSTTLPHLHDIVGALLESPQEGGPLLIDLLLDSALF